MTALTNPPTPDRLARGELLYARRKYELAAKEFAESEAYTAYIEENLMQANAAYGDEFADYLAENSAALEAVVGK